jgi:hypothetical protein
MTSAREHHSRDSADSGNKAIRKVTPQGLVTTLAARLAGEPNGIAIGKDRSLYITLLRGSTRSVRKAS